MQNYYKPVLFLIFMKNKNVELNKIKKIIVATLKKYGVKRAGIFGSYVRGEQRKGSDIDVLIEPPRGIGLEFAGIEIELEKNLGKKVDLITYKYLSPYLKKKILESEVKII